MALHCYLVSEKAPPRFKKTTKNNVLDGVRIWMGHG